MRKQKELLKKRQAATLPPALPGKFQEPTARRLRREGGLGRRQSSSVHSLAFLARARGHSVNFLAQRRELRFPGTKSEAWIFRVGLIVKSFVTRLHVRKECPHDGDHLGHVHIIRQGSGERLGRSITVPRRHPGQAGRPDLRALLPECRRQIQPTWSGMGIALIGSWERKRRLRHTHREG